jgi:hypothetical protein
MNKFKLDLKNAYRFLYLKHWKSKTSDFYKLKLKEIEKILIK